MASVMSSANNKSAFFTLSSIITSMICTTMNAAQFLFRREAWLPDGREFRPRWMPIQALNSCHNRVGIDAVLDLVSARGRPGAVIFHLGHLGHRSWCPEGIDAPRGFNLAEKVLAPCKLEAKLSRSSIDRHRVSIERHREQKHGVVVAADG